MPLQALKTNPARRQTSRGFSLPAPIGGLNGRDPLTGMDAEDAIILDNVFPEANYAALRRGHSAHATGVGSAEVETLMTYHAANGTEKLFAIGNDNAVYDCTSAGAASSVYTGSISASRWQWIAFSTTSQQHILAFDGTNTPIKYDGTNWSINVITGSISSSATLINACSHRERVWMVQKDSLNAWYLASQAISGVATKLPLQGVFNLGGSLVACGTFSVDAGDGMDDLLCFVTSNGEVAVYSGTNPASDFALQGVYHIGEPLGNRCLMKLGGDLNVITTTGVVPLSQMVNFDRSKSERVAITARVSDTFNRAARDYRNNFGWQGIVYPRARQAIINIPSTENAVQYQLVQNTITGRWCSFSSLNANCWALLDEAIYFGGNDGKVYAADTGYTDNAGAINFEIKGSFNYYGARGRQKFFKMLRALLLTSGSVSISIGMDVDFANNPPSGTLSAPSSNAGIWGTGLWGTALWAGTGLLFNSWSTVGEIGYAGAIHMKGQSNGVAIQVNGFDVHLEYGGAL